MKKIRLQGKTEIRNRLIKNYKFSITDQLNTLAIYNDGAFYFYQNSECIRSQILSSSVRNILNSLVAIDYGQGNLKSFNKNITKMFNEIDTFLNSDYDENIYYSIYQLIDSM